VSKILISNALKEKQLSHFEPEREAIFGVDEYK